MNLYTSEKNCKISQWNRYYILLLQVQELQKLDSLVRDQVNLANQYAEKLIANKMSKQQYVDYESTVKGKRNDLIGKMEAILNTL